MNNNPSSDTWRNFRLMITSTGPGTGSRCRSAGSSTVETSPIVEGARGFRQ